MSDVNKLYAKCVIFVYAASEISPPKDEGDHDIKIPSSGKLPVVEHMEIPEELAIKPKYLSKEELRSRQIEELKREVNKEIIKMPTNWEDESSSKEERPTIHDTVPVSRRSTIPV